MREKIAFTRRGMKCAENGNDGNDGNDGGGEMSFFP